MTGLCAQRLRREKSNWFLVASIILVTLPAILDCSIAHAKTPPLQLCVNKAGSGGCSTTIQAAVNLVPAGGSAVITIAADGSPYAEDVTVSGISVDFVGAGAGMTVVDGTNGGTDPTFLFQNSASGEFHGMTIENGSGGVGGNIQFKQLDAKNHGVGTLKIFNCEITGSNQSNPGPNGAIDFFGQLLVIDSTSITNNANNGINVARGRAFISNTTISGNAGHGVTGCGMQVGAGCSASLDNDTITNNSCKPGDQASQGGGLFLDVGLKSFAMANTVVAGNSAATGPDCESNGKLKSKGFNLVQNVSGCPFKAAKSDVTGIDPGLGTLSSCGGSPLQVQEPMGGSPLIGAGNPKNPTGKVGTNATTCLPTDECGSARAAGSCTIGAVQ